MNTPEDYESSTGQLNRIIEQGGQRISLIEFTTLPQLQDLLHALGAAHPDRPLIEQTYDPLRLNASQLIANLEQRLSNLSDDPLPLVVLHPQELSASPESEAAAHDFWQGMNFRREVLSRLHAQFLLFVDPWHNQRLIDRAPDLWSWLMPKVDLTLPSDPRDLRNHSLPAVAYFNKASLSPEAAAAQWQHLWPILQQKASTHRIESGDFRRLIFPLLESALTSGNLIQARLVRDAGITIQIPTKEQILWHRLNGLLACGGTEFIQAEEHVRQLLCLLEKSSTEKEQVQAVSAINELATLLSRLGQAQAGEHLFRRLITWCESHLGDQHPFTLTCRANMAVTLQEQGKFAEAADEHLTVLKLRQKVLGEEHADTLVSRNNYANALHRLGKHSEAEEEIRAVLQIRQTALGPEHLDTLVSRNNLAATLNASGKHSEAEAEHREVLAIRERVLGGDVPDSLQSRNNLALALAAQGRFAEAEEENRKVLALRQRVLGDDHPDTLTTRHNLATNLQSQGKYLEAEREQRALLELRQRVLGKDHPYYFETCFNLAHCLNAQGKRVEALKFARQAREGCKNVLGEDHSYTKAGQQLVSQLQEAD